jgi:hypothetical protein
MSFAGSGSFFLWQRNNPPTSFENLITQYSISDSSFHSGGESFMDAG